TKNHKKKNKPSVTKKAANWLLNIAEIPTPNANMAEETRIKPIYEEMTIFQSMPGETRLFRTIGKTKVIAAVESTNIKAPSHLPATNSKSLTGAVSINSRVPMRASSEMRRMVIAGDRNTIKNTNNQLT